MDDLCIRMIMNSKKLNIKRDEKRSLSDPFPEIIQIFREHFLTYPMVRERPNEFAEFLRSKAPTILAAFDKLVSGKHE